MTIEELKKLNIIQGKIVTLKEHLEKLRGSNPGKISFHTRECGNIDAKSDIINVDYLYNAYIHKVEAELALSEKLFEKWKLTR